MFDDMYRVWFPGFYHDCLSLLEKVVTEAPHCEIYLVGYSVGTAAIQKLLLHLSIEQSKICASSVVAAMCVCTCHNYELARDHLESNLQGSVYSFLMTKMHQLHLHKNLHIFDGNERDNVNRVLKSNFLSEFDAHAATRLFGFETEGAYVDWVSFPSLQAVSVPLVIIQPSDDPLIQVRPI
jgi:predicted alpha/beta-fold hydrolase